MTDTGWTWPVAQITDVHDGDTVKAHVSLGFDVWALVWVRLLRVRAPELRDEGGDQARLDVRNWLDEHARNWQVQLVTYRSSQPLEIRFRQSFTRYLGEISVDGANLNDWLRERGYVDQGA